MRHLPRVEGSRIDHQSVADPGELAHRRRVSCLDARQPIGGERGQPRSLFGGEAEALTQLANRLGERSHRVETLLRWPPALRQPEFVVCPCDEESGLAHCFYRTLYASTTRRNASSSDAGT